MGLTKDSKLASPDYVAKYYKVLKGSVSLAADATSVIDVAGLLGAEAAKYDLESVRVSTFILDSDSTSKTYGYYVDGSAAIATGFKANGNVILHNAYVSNIAVTWEISVRLK